MKSSLRALIATLLIVETTTHPININVVHSQPHNAMPEILRPNHAPHLTHGLPTFLKGGAVMSSVALIGAFVRLYNKDHKQNHFSFLQTLNPLNVLTHPLQCLDDGLIGHIGSGNARPYGVLGTSMSWVPKIDGTITAMDQTKRKVESWVEWINRNVSQIRNAEPEMSSVVTHAKAKFAQLCEALAG